MKGTSPQLCCADPQPGDVCKLPPGPGTVSMEQLINLFPVFHDSACEGRWLIRVLSPQQMHEEGSRRALLSPWPLVTRTLGRQDLSVHLELGVPPWGQN